MPVYPGAPLSSAPAACSVSIGAVCTQRQNEKELDFRSAFRHVRHQAPEPQAADIPLSVGSGGGRGMVVRSAAAAQRARADGMAQVAAMEVLMPFRLATAVTFAVLLMVPSSGNAQVLMQRDVSLRMALTIAEAALAECGVKTLVAVVDRAGRLRVFLQGDGAAPHNLELARRKAYTARTFQRTSAEWEAHRDHQCRAADACRRHSARRRGSDQGRRGDHWRRRPERSPNGPGAGRGLCQGWHCQSSGSASVRLTAMSLAA